jgi:perosamine synthetase
MTSVDLSVPPALLGGPPINPQGPPDWPPPDEGVRRALESAFLDGSWGRYHGGHVERLEKRLAEWLGVAHVLTCSSGTFAVEAALRSVPVALGDEVILAGYDYPGNFLSVHAVGGKPVLIDIDPRSWNLADEMLPAALSPATKAVIVSHLHGGLAPIQQVVALCRERGVVVIEDAAQAVGATVQGKPAGAGGDIGVLSFGGSKLLSAGRGGALVTNRPDLHQRARLVLGRGNNLVSPLSELQACVLLPQLDLLPHRHTRRAAAVVRLKALLEEIPGIRVFGAGGDGSPAYYKVGLQFDESAFGLARGRLVAAMRAEGIAFDEGFRALHVGRSASRWRPGGALEECTRAHQGVVVLHHPVLLQGDAAIDLVGLALRRIHTYAERLR